MLSTSGKNITYSCSSLKMLHVVNTDRLFGTANKECADNKTLPCGIMLSALLKALISFAHLVFFNCPTPFLLCELSPCILSQKVPFQQAPTPELTITQKLSLLEDHLQNPDVLTLAAHESSLWCKMTDHLQQPHGKLIMTFPTQYANRSC